VAPGRALDFTDRRVLLRLGEQAGEGEGCGDEGFGEHHGIPFKGEAKKY
jgi:hypothetical protein